MKLNLNKNNENITTVKENTEETIIVEQPKSTTTSFEDLPDIIDNSEEFNHTQEAEDYSSGYTYESEVTNSKYHTKPMQPVKAENKKVSKKAQKLEEQYNALVNGEFKDEKTPELSEADRAAMEQAKVAKIKRKVARQTVFVVIGVIIGLILVVNVGIWAVKAIDQKNVYDAEVAIAQEKYDDWMSAITGFEIENPDYLITEEGLTREEAIDRVITSMFSVKTIYDDVNNNRDEISILGTENGAVGIQNHVKKYIAKCDNWILSQYDAMYEEAETVEELENLKDLVESIGKSWNIWVGVDSDKNADANKDAFITKVDEKIEEIS